MFCFEEFAAFVIGLLGDLAGFGFHRHQLLLTKYSNDSSISIRFIGKEFNIVVNINVPLTLESRDQPQTITLAKINAVDWNLIITDQFAFELTERDNSIGLVFFRFYELCEGLFLQS